jgi:hypothetical protein
MRIPHLLFTAACALALSAASASAFCGFYVSRADATLYNQASKVVLVRDGDRTVLTMVNDFQGSPDEFAMVVPVPTFVERGQINVGNMGAIDHLDAYTAPRLVEYFDEDPCRVSEIEMALQLKAGVASADGSLHFRGGRADDLGVTIEATYTVGEYDILILSAEESSGLETWLIGNGYKIPAGASKVLESYLRQNMRFFVAKVNLKEQAKLGFNMLRPLQVAFESPKFMLPIRLGTVNANGPQELFIFALTKTGRVETTNYRTVKLPSDVEIPPFVKNEFADFYRSMFDRQVERERMRAVFLEYAWDMAWCDPCASNPLSRDELGQLGVFWLDDANLLEPRDRRIAAPNVYVTRLHVRYDGDHFPDDLVFQETGDRTNFQGRYVMRHPWTGSSECEAAVRYREEVRERQIREAQDLANLTGWDLDEILAKADIPAAASGAGGGSKWWQKLWRK